MYNDPKQNAERKMKERVAFFRFSDTKGNSQTVKYDGLNVKFNIQFFSAADEIGFGGNTASFGICNLSPQTMRMLANRFNDPERGGELNRVEFFAGYRDLSGNTYKDDISLLFDGNILKTSATAPPDVWFNFHGHSNGGQYVTPIEKTLDSGDKPLTFLQVCQAVAYYCNLALIYQAENEFSMNTYTISGTQRQALRQLQSVNPVLFTVTVMNGVLLVYDRGKGNEVLSKFSGKWYISEKSGMIGVPEFTPVGANVTTVLNPHILPNDIVELKSSLMPYWNGTYRVGRMEHFGELRGKDFCTKLELWLLEK